MLAEQLLDGVFNDGNALDEANVMIKQELRGKRIPEAAIVTNVVKDRSKPAEIMCCRMGTNAFESLMDPQ